MTVAELNITLIKHHRMLRGVGVRVWLAVVWIHLFGRVRWAWEVAGRVLSLDSFYLFNERVVPHGDTLNATRFNVQVLVFIHYLLENVLRQLLGTMVLLVVGVVSLHLLIVAPALVNWRYALKLTMRSIFVLSCEYIRSGFDFNLLFLVKKVLCQLVLC